MDPCSQKLKRRNTVCVAGFKKPVMLENVWMCWEKRGYFNA